MASQCSGRMATENRHDHCCLSHPPPPRVFDGLDGPCYHGAMRLSWRDHFHPFANMKLLEGSVRERREILQHNCQEKLRVAEVGHRWGQVAALAAATATALHLGGYSGWAALIAVLAVASATAAALLGCVWAGLTMLQRHIAQ